MAQVDAKVAKVLDEYRVALNAGTEAGVAVNSAVTLWRPVQVKDPDTGELLGTVYLDTLRLSIEEAYERMSVARVSPDTGFLFNFGSTRKRIEVARENPSSEIVRVKEGDVVSISVRDFNSSDEDIHGPQEGP